MTTFRMMRRKLSTIATATTFRIRAGARECAAALAAFALVCGGWPVQTEAQIFTCKDERGRTLSSDRPIPECSQRPMRELNNNGVVKREIAAPLTKEQVRQKEIDDEQRQAADNRRRQQESRDKALLLAYANVAALERARTKQIDDINDSIGAAQKRMIASHLDLSAAQAAADAIKGRPVPDAMRKRIKQIAQSILDEDAAIVKRRAEQDRINQQFDQDSQRLRMLLRDDDVAHALEPPQR